MVSLATVWFSYVKQNNFDCFKNLNDFLEKNECKLEDTFSNTAGQLWNL